MTPVDNGVESSALAAGTTLPSMLAMQAQHAPTAPAILAPQRTPVSYQTLQRRVGELAADLTDRGIGRGDAVALVLPNGPESARLFLAAASVGAAAPLNPAYQAPELEFFLGDLAARLLVIDADLDSPARDVARGLGIPVVEAVRETEEMEAGLVRFGGDGAATTRAAADGPGAHDIALVLHTSGTTSRPKQVPLSHGNLMASAAHIGSALRLSQADRCLNVMPLFHIHGLVAAALSSLRAGGSVVCTPGFHAPDFFAWMEETEPTWYTAVPTMHQAILARAQANRAVIDRARLRFVRSSSSALPRSTLAELETVFAVPVVEAYGMTEAAHQIASNPLPPGTRKPGSVGPAAGPAVAILGPAGERLGADQTGEVAIRGPNVTAGYAHNPEANRTAFEHGWFRTGDQGYLDRDGFVFLTGRLKEIINRGGEKIAPVEVDEALMGHPGVQQALAFAVRHPQLGEDVAAAVVLRAGAHVAERELREFVATRVAYFKVPRRVLFLKEIPKGPTGKLQRIGLADRLGIPAFDAVPVDAPPVAPRTPVEEILAALWGQILRCDPPGVYDNFFAAGGDSVTATQLVARVRDSLRVELPLLSFFDAPTVADTAAEIERLLAAES